MCGIAGIVNFDKKPISFRDLTVMTDRINHRGPDGEGTVLLSENPAQCRFHSHAALSQAAGNYHAAFAHRRLSIIDLTDNGIQPMSANKGEMWITYNGEIFNYIELRKEL